MKKLIKTNFFVPIATILAEFLLFLIWGLALSGGDEMGYSLIALYIVFPITAIIFSIRLVLKRSISFFSFAATVFAAQLLLPFFIFSTFEILFSIGATLIPCFFGAFIAIIISYFKKQK